MKKKSSVPSPCISVCTVEEETGYCKGCLRTLAEIASWDAMGDAEKQRVWKTLEARRQSQGTDEMSHC